MKTATVNLPRFLQHRAPPARSAIRCAAARSAPAPTVAPPTERDELRLAWAASFGVTGGSWRDWSWRGEGK